MDQHLTPEQTFERSVAYADRKRRGQFFTPPPVAGAMVRWACARSPETFLDPAVGPGIFLECLANLSIRPPPRTVAFDIDSAAIDAARSRLEHHQGSGVEFRHEDFLAARVDETFDAIVCNPPYIRHHDADLPESLFTRFDRRFNTRFSRLTNIYGLFLMRIMTLLSPRGRAAIITPTEFLNADFGRALKEVLIAAPAFRGCIVFDYTSSIFDGLITTATITLLEQGADPVCESEVRFAHLKSETSLDACFALFDGKPSGSDVADELFRRDELDPASKWATSRRAPQAKRASNSAARDLRPLAEFARCTRGIATGYNAFFTLTEDEARQWGIPAELLKPCVTKALDARRPVFTQSDFEQLRADGRKVYLLDVTPGDAHHVAGYLRHGESLGVHRRYLTRHRTPWYICERRDPADLWVTVFGRRRLRFVHNQAGVLTLTPFHCIYLQDRFRRSIPLLMDYFASGSFLDASAAEHRVYGDGLLKFEPRDVLRLPLPDLERLDDQTKRESHDSLFDPPAIAVSRPNRNSA